MSWLIEGGIFVVQIFFHNIPDEGTNPQIDVRRYEVHHTEPYERLVLCYGDLDQENCLINTSYNAIHAQNV